MQVPTCERMHVRSPEDARTIFHAVRMNIIPMVARRLDADERQRIRTGNVYVWEERNPNAELTGVGIERWTDGIRWGPSRVRDGFLFYEEKRERPPVTDSPYNVDNLSLSRMDRTLLHKQTYTVWVELPIGRRKWHLIAYYTEHTIHTLLHVSDLPALASLNIPHNDYPSARHPKGRAILQSYSPPSPLSTLSSSVSMSPSSSTSSQESDIDLQHYGDYSASAPYYSPRPMHPQPTSFQQQHEYIMDEWSANADEIPQIYDRSMSDRTRTHSLARVNPGYYPPHTPCTPPPQISRQHYNDQMRPTYQMPESTLSLTPLQQAMSYSNRHPEDDDAIMRLPLSIIFNPRPSV